MRAALSTISRCRSCGRMVSRKASPRPCRKSKTRVSSTWISSFERSSCADAPALALIGEKPANERGDKQPEEEESAWEPKPSLLRGVSCWRSCFRYSRTSLNAGQIFRGRLAESLMRLEHRARLLSFRGCRFSAASRSVFAGPRIPERRPRWPEYRKFDRDPDPKAVRGCVAPQWTTCRWPWPSSFKRSAMPAIVPMKVESIMAHFSRSKTNSR